MYDLLFVLIYLVYAFQAVKIEKWTALSTLADKRNVPHLFAKYPEIFLTTNTFMLLAAVSASFMTVAISNYFSIPSVVITFLSVVSLGRRLAYREYKKQHDTALSYGEFHKLIIKNKRVIKKRKFKDGSPIK